MIFVDFNDEHVFLIAFPVAGFFPQLAVHNLRCVHLDVATSTLTAAHVVLQLCVYSPTVRVPKHLTGGFFLHVEQVHFAAQLAVVTLCGFFQAVKMLLEPFFVGKCSTVNPLQHCAVAIAAPIGTRDGHQFKPVCGDLASVLQVWATAQVLPVAVPIHAQRLVTWDAFNQLDLIWLALVLIMRNRAGTVPDFGPHRLTPIDDLFHLFFNGRKVVGHKCLFAVKIIIPAVFDHRADCDLHVRP